MKASSSLQGWLAWRTAAAFIVGAAMITGCGGVGTGGTGGATVNTAVIAGKVADGYLVNALVFLDKNGNYQLDPGEPFTTSDQGGGYSLNVNPADIGTHPIVAVAIKGQTIDKDTGLTVANSYVLSTPASTVSGTGANFVSPISSQVRELMETGQYATLQQAMDQVRTRMGLSAGTDVLADYKATNNTVMSTAAMNIAGLMGSQMSYVLGANGTSVTVDVNRYRGMVGNIFQNLSVVTAASTSESLSGITAYVTSSVSVIPAGQPFVNMSSAFRGIESN